MAVEIGELHKADAYFDKIGMTTHGKLPPHLRVALHKAKGELVRADLVKLDKLLEKTHPDVATPRIKLANQIAIDKGARPALEYLLHNVAVPITIRPLGNGFVFTHPSHEGIEPKHVTISIGPFQNEYDDLLTLRVNTSATTKKGTPLVNAMSTNQNPLIHAPYRSGKQVELEDPNCDPKMGDRVGLSEKHVFTIGGRAFAIAKITPDAIVLNTMTANSLEPETITIPRDRKSDTQFSIGSHPGDYICLRTARKER